MICIKIFSSKVELAAGEPLGGSDPNRFSQSPSDALEVNGFAFTAGDGRTYRICSVDALYAGRLVERLKSEEAFHIFAASHTHYAPMLDDNKPYIGGFSQVGFDAYVRALVLAANREVEISRCRLYLAEVDVPVYRRFDYPDSSLNRFLASRFGFYPNEAMPIDRSIYLFEFGDIRQGHFVVVYHACHPVTQGVGCELSPDYIGAIRQAVRDRFSIETVVFLQGCAGDIRPNLAKKRIPWLPRFRLNWKFNWFPAEQVITQVYEKYANAIRAAVKSRDIVLGECPFDVSTRELRLADGREVETFRIGLPGGIEFHFLPFEVSHLYHFDATSASGKKFIVSCANDTGGYLSHPSQHQAGGYEVHGSLHYMGLKEKLEIKESI